MVCPNCGTEIRANSMFCHQCGITIYQERVKDGRSIVKWAIAIVCLNLLPSIGMVLIAVRSSTSDITYPPGFITAVLSFTVSAILLVVAVLLYRLHIWAKFVLGLSFIISGTLSTMISLISALVSLPTSSLCLFLPSLLYVLFEVYLLRSKEVDLFVKHQAEKGLVEK